MILLNQEKHRLWVAMRLGMGASAFPTICGSVGHHDDDGNILAAVVYTDYSVFPETGRGVCWGSIASMPGTNWCTRRFVRAFLSYAFDGLGVCVLRALCARNNMPSRQFMEKLGMRFVGRGRRGFDGKQDAMYYDMIPPEAERWLGYRPVPIKQKEADHGR